MTSQPHPNGPASHNTSSWDGAAATLQMKAGGLAVPVAGGADTDAIGGGGVVGCQGRRWQRLCGGGSGVPGEVVAEVVWWWWGDLSRSPCSPGVGQDEELKI